MPKQRKVTLFSPSRSTTPKPHIRRRVLIGTALLLTISLVLVSRLSKSPTIYAVEPIDLQRNDDRPVKLPVEYIERKTDRSNTADRPSAGKKVALENENNRFKSSTTETRDQAEEGPRPPPGRGQSYPGFATEPSVLCGAHTARSCDMCPQGNGAGWCNGQCAWRDGACGRSAKTAHVHPDYFRIVERYAFQPAMTQDGTYVNVVLVRSPFRRPDDEDLYRFYKDGILFLGISSFESFPLTSPNPFSEKVESSYYLNMFPGFLHMMRDPDAHFPREVKTILLSQSDFNLDDAMTTEQKGKIYDFVYSGGDQDVENDCIGWASYNKNFSFVRQALEVMCSPEFNVTGVLVANKNKAGTKACTIPAACKGKMVQTTFLDQGQFFGYLAKARWAFLPQVCDASPRVSTQAMAMNLPLLMNGNIMGGWKYLVPGETGEFFHDMSDFRDSLRKMLDNTRGGNSPYQPLEFVRRGYGSANSGKRLLEFVRKHWGDWIHIPDDAEYLVPTGA